MSCSNIVSKTQGEAVAMTKAAYLTDLKKSYNTGGIEALTKIGKTPEEIAKILNLNESYVRRILLDVNL